MNLKSWLTDIQVIKIKIQPDGDLDDVEEGYDRACKLEKEIKEAIKNDA